jgi:hypothetical protein
MSPFEARAQLKVRAGQLTGGSSRSATAHVGYPDGRLIAGAIRRRHASRPKAM